MEQEMKMGRLFTARAGLRRLQRVHGEGLLTDEMWVGLRQDYHQAQQQLVGDISQLFTDHPLLERELPLQGAGRPCRRNGARSPTRSGAGCSRTGPTRISGNVSITALKRWA
jgi:hypothetical protein